MYLAIGALALLAACAAGGPDASTPLLNSERIKSRFGSYGVSILEQTPTRRDTCLYSLEAGRKVCRTIAVVSFEPIATEALAGPLDAIRRGASLGQTLADAGWKVLKVNRHLGHYALEDGSDPTLTGLFQIGGPARLALHIYDLRAARDGDVFAVATLMEIHHPDYLDEASLRRIYSSLPTEALTAGQLAEWRLRVATIPAGGILFD